MTHVDEQAAFLVKGKKAYRIRRFNAEVGRIDLETEFGVELTTTSEQAEKCGYAAAAGFVRKSLGESRVLHRFLDEHLQPFDGKPA